MKCNNTLVPTCSTCGLCCRLFVINLNEAEYRSGNYRTVFEELELSPEYNMAESCGANLLKQNPDGSCTYLVDNRCSIHEKRPEVCTRFFCQGHEPEFRVMRQIVERARRI